MLAILSWVFSAAVWPGFVLLLLAVIYGISLATGGPYAENLVDAGQRLSPIITEVIGDFRNTTPTPASGPSAAAFGAPGVAPFGAPGVAPLALGDQQRASDPRTDHQTLMDLAWHQPELRPLIAANPSAYPALVQWLRDLHDPRIDEALRRR